MSAERVLQLVTSESGPKGGRTDGTLHRVNYSIPLRLGDEIKQTDIDGNRFCFEVTPRGEIIISQLELGPDSKLFINGRRMKPDAIQKLRGKIIQLEETSIELAGPTCSHRLGFYEGRGY